MNHNPSVGFLAMIAARSFQSKMMKPKIVNCPTCGKPVEWTSVSRFRPFCSERCKTRDLGAWAAEEYKVAGDPLPEADFPIQRSGTTETD